jgi:hypothetical protein
MQSEIKTKSSHNGLLRARLKEANQINMSTLDKRLPKNATDKVW